MMNRVIQWLGQKFLIQQASSMWMEASWCNLYEWVCHNSEHLGWIASRKRRITSEVVFLIYRTTICLQRMMNYASEIEENGRKTFSFDRLFGFFKIFALQAASIGSIWLSCRHNTHVFFGHMFIRKIVPYFDE